MVSSAPAVPFHVVHLAAGRGSRLTSNADDVAKQFRLLGGRPVWQHALSVFTRHKSCQGGVVVFPKGHPASLDGYNNWLVATGGLTRQESAKAGLDALATGKGSKPKAVMVHDAARPFISLALLDRLLGEFAKAKGKQAVIPALPPRDSIKATHDGFVEAGLDRDRVRLIQTPQLFDFATLHRFHQKEAAEGGYADDSELYEYFNLPVRVVDGEAMAFKITSDADWQLAQILTAGLGETKVGFGYDIHQFADADATSGGTIMLCGVAIPHNRSLVAHSDGDVGLHAATDAVLATIAQGDIGSHFPPSDKKWQGADSAQFLAFACGRLRDAGGQLVHLDVTIIAEAPKITQHRQAMCARLAEITGLDATRQVSVKATTNEGLGAIGEGKAIACQALATARLPMLAV